MKFLLTLFLFASFTLSAQEELKLDLYYKVSCPFSQKVIRYLNQNGIAIGYKDIGRDKETKEELLELTGSTRVPCLSINGMMMHESDDIIEYCQHTLLQ